MQAHSSWNSQDKSFTQEKRTHQWSQVLVLTTVACWVALVAPTPKFHQLSSFPFVPSLKTVYECPWWGEGEGIQLFPVLQGHILSSEVLLYRQREQCTNAPDEGRGRVSNFFQWFRATFLRCPNFSISKIAIEKCKLN